MSNPTGSASATGSAGSSDKSYLIGGAVCAVIGFVLYVVSFIRTSTFLGTTDSWNDIQSNAMPTVLGTAIGGGIMIFIACAIYFSQVSNPQYMTYAILGMASFALCFSYASIAISVMTKASS